MCFFTQGRPVGGSEILKKAGQICPALAFLVTAILLHVLSNQKLAKNLNSGIISTTNAI